MNPLKVKFQYWGVEILDNSHKPYDSISETISKLYAERVNGISYIKTAEDLLNSEIELKKEVLKSANKKQKKQFVDVNEVTVKLEHVEHYPTPSYAIYKGTIDYILTSDVYTIVAFISESKIACYHDSDLELLILDIPKKDKGAIIIQQ
jgi:hypothetical protein